MLVDCAIEAIIRIGVMDDQAFFRRIDCARNTTIVQNSNFSNKFSLGNEGVELVGIFVIEKECAAFAIRLVGGYFNNLFQNLTESFKSRNALGNT